MEGYAQWKPFNGTTLVANLNFTDNYAENIDANLKQHLTSVFYYININQKLPWKLIATAYTYGQTGHSPENIYAYSRSWWRYAFTLQRSFLSDDYPAFAAITNSICAAGTASSEEVAAILSAAQDKAPDALLSVVYNREVQTASGRTKWHGRRMGQYVIDAGEDQSSLVELYEDGFVWTNAAKRVTLADPEAAAKAKAAAEARQAEWERANLPPDVAALLAARRAAATTNEVTVTVGANGEVSVQPGITTSDPGPTVPTGNQ